VIFAYITGFARAQLMSFVKEYHLEKDVVAFATDSVCVTRKIKMDSSELGGFSLDKHALDAYYLQNGFYRFGSWKQRGIGKLGRKEIEHIETIERDGRLYYQYKVLRTKKLASAIISNQIEDIGKLKEETREVNLNGDDKRFWLGRLESVNNKKLNKSTSLSPQIFPDYFKLNPDYNAD
ncbi:MAG: DNA polymerase, partial [Nitrosopumilus sp.]|nr:DNA polymerase [Nitrosopumilus sp.]